MLGNSVRPLKNRLFCPTSALGSNLSPQNTPCIPAVTRSEASALTFSPALPVPILLSGNLDKTDRFSKVSLLLMNVNEAYYKVDENRGSIKNAVTLEGCEDS
jgi:hypothetical protein